MMMQTTHPLAARSPLPVRSNRFPTDHPGTVAQFLYRLRPIDGAEDGTDARSPEIAQLEAAFFLADEPLTIRRIISAMGASDAAEARKWIGQLQNLYESEGSAFQIEELAGGFQLLTREPFHHWLVRFQGGGNELKLTPAARETLAIVAYRQPINRADIDVIRGAQSSDVLRQLMERSLIRISGRESTLGRPVLYSTTKKFLQLLGLRNIKDLPRWAELSQKK